MRNKEFQKLFHEEWIIKSIRGHFLGAAVFCCLIIEGTEYVAINLYKIII